MSANDLAGAIAVLQPEQPLVLMGAIVATDSGHAVLSCYMDIGLEKVPYRPKYLLKPTESKYGLEHSSNIQLSAPRRFRDEQESQARKK